MDQSIPDGRPQRLPRRNMRFTFDIIFGVVPAAFCLLFSLVGSALSLALSFTPETRAFGTVGLTALGLIGLLASFLLILVIFLRGKVHSVVARYGIAAILGLGVWIATPFLFGGIGALLRGNAPSAFDMAVDLAVLSIIVVAVKYIVILLFRRTG